MQLEEFYEYKNLLMKQLCSNEDIVKLVTCNDDADVPNHGLPYTQFFPYEFIPETVGDGKTFICFDVDVQRVPNKTTYLVVLYVWIFTHKSQLRLPDGGGCILDRLAVDVNKMLNGSRYYSLGEFSLDSVERFVPITDYLGRVLTFRGVELNRFKGRMDSPAVKRPNREVD